MAGVLAGARARLLAVGRSLIPERSLVRPWRGARPVPRIGAVARADGVPRTCRGVGPVAMAGTRAESGTGTIARLRMVAGSTGVRRTSAGALPLAVSVAGRWTLAMMRSPGSWRRAMARRRSVARWWSGIARWWCDVAG